MSDHSPGHDVATVDTVGDPIADPGLHEHQPRPTDVDERAEKRAERQIATLFGLSSIFAILFVVSYFVFKVGHHPTIIGGYGASNVALGATLGIALLLIGIGLLVLTVRWIREPKPAASTQPSPAAPIAPVPA